jgi:hypothetical protein
MVIPSLEYEFQFERPLRALLTYMECARLIVLQFCRKQNIANKHCNNAEIKAYTRKVYLHHKLLEVSIIWKINLD